MPNVVNKVKHLPTGKIFVGETEICEQPIKEVLAETKKSVRNSVELPYNWWSSHSSVGTNNKLKKLDLIKLNHEKMNEQNFPKPVDWEVSDGDYMHAMTENENHQPSYLEVRKRLDRIFFGVALVFIAIIILFLSFMTSSIHNF